MEGTKKPKYRLSPKANAVWAKLDGETREAIQHDNPFKRDRNEAIYRLRLRGVEIDVLAEITNLHRLTIMKVEKNIKGDRSFDVGQNLRRIRKAFKDFYKSCVYYTHDDKD